MQYIAEQNSGLLLEEFQKDAKLRPDLYLNTGEKKLKIQFQKCFAGLLKGIF